VNTPSPAALRAATAWFRQPLDIRLHKDVITELAALIDREYQSALITEAQVVSYLREKCAELQSKAGGNFAAIEVRARLLAGDVGACDWRAYITGGERYLGNTADEAIAGILTKAAPEVKGARLRAEITAAQNELAKLEAAK
jgi:hypothetical protein